MCILCHTDQWRIGQTESTVSGTTIVPPAGTTDTHIVRGEAILNFPVLIHKTHRGKDLTLTGYNFGGFSFNEFTYTQEIATAASVMSHLRQHPGGTTGRTIPAGLPAVPVMTASTGRRERVTLAARRPSVMIRFPSTRRSLID